MEGGSEVGEGGPNATIRFQSLGPMRFPRLSRAEAPGWSSMHIPIPKIPHARYLVREPTGLFEWPRWRCVSYPEYVQHRGRKRTPAAPAGVVEVFAQSGTIAWQDREGHQDHRDYWFPPRILENGKGSTINSAVEQASFFSSVAAVKELAAVTDTVIVTEVPDNCPAEFRHKHQVAEELEPYQNVCYDEAAGCIAHTLHNSEVKVTGEVNFIGHLHAYQYVTAISGRVQELLHGLRVLIEKEMVTIPGAPPPEEASYVDTVLDHSLLRMEKQIRGRLNDMDPNHHEARRGATFRDRAVSVRCMCNGRLRGEIVIHYEQGCCRDEHGVVTRATQVNNMYAALSGCGIFGSLEKTKPGKQRWLSGSKVQSMVVAGYVVQRPPRRLPHPP